MIERYCLSSGTMSGRSRVHRKSRAMWTRGARRLLELRWSGGLSCALAARVSALSARKACRQHSALPGVSRTAQPRRWYSPESGLQKEEAQDLPGFNINVLVNLLRQENGRDLCVIRVPPEVKYVAYFVIVVGTSPRHLQAMAQYTVKVYKHLKLDTMSHVRIEGKDTDDWMCIDFGDIVVHFMLPETRETYELEKLWTLRSHDDQLSEMLPEVLPLDFTFGLHQNI